MAQLGLSLGSGEIRLVPHPPAGNDINPRMWQELTGCGDPWTTPPCSALVLPLQLLLWLMVFLRLLVGSFHLPTMSFPFSILRCFSKEHGSAEVGGQVVEEGGSLYLTRLGANE